MTQQHQAAFLDGVNQPLRVGPTDTPKPGPGELLIKTAAVAINPIDWKIQGSGMFIKTWPTILGLDLAGEVFAVGDGVTAFAKGQRVIAYSQLLPSLNIDRAAYQEFVIAPQAGVAPLPDSVPYEAGVVLPLAVSTAAAGLFPSPLLGLDTPSVPPAKKNGKTLLVWGASSSVGATAIQLAVAAGYDVVATASRSNFDLVRGLGAKVVLDYHSSSIVEDLVAELKKGGGFVGAYDAIGLRETQLPTAQVVHELGGGTVAAVLPPIEDGPENVTIQNVFASSIFLNFGEVGKAVWGDFLPKALKTGQLKSAPPYEVVGKGLGSLQAAFDHLKAGVSATKVVVTL
ncbi:hypothetical protein MGN70_014767 [Eutypa lata]|nr:hypothetical protein MGN70_014767 [Eutypa lata]